MLTDDEISAIKERGDLMEVMAYSRGMSAKERFFFFGKIGMGKHYSIDATASVETLEQELAFAIEHGAEGVNFIGMPPTQIFVKASQIPWRVSITP